MKLFEVLGRGIDRSIESDWRDQMASQAAARRNAPPAAPSATNGFWLISREGKRLAGPFTTAVNAEKYKSGRPDKIPANAVVKPL